MIAGIDEAGRGPVIGPMCVSGVMIPERGQMRINLRDSKRLSVGRRAQIASVLEKKYDFYTLKVSASEIDEMRMQKGMKMDEIVVDSFVDVIKRLRPTKVYVDAADVNEARFGANIREKCSGIEIVSEHKADEKYPIVAAASILAKVRRDESIEDLRKKIGKDIGSGYPSDQRTIDFLRELRGKKIPSYVRHSWKTVERLIY